MSEVDNIAYKLYNDVALQTKWKIIYYEKKEWPVSSKRIFI